MSVNCFRSKNLAGHVTTSARDNSLRDRFAGLFRLIQRVKDFGAPEKIKRTFWRRRRSKASHSRLNKEHQNGQQEDSVSGLSKVKDARLEHTDESVGRAKLIKVAPIDPPPPEGERGDLPSKLTPQSPNATAESPARDRPDIRPAQSDPKSDKRLNVQRILTPLPMTSSRISNLYDESRLLKMSRRVILRQMVTHRSDPSLAPLHVEMAD